MSDCLVDPFGRTHNYVRISVTDHCNLGCQYCMPGKGLVAHSNLLTFDEIVEVVRILAEMGVTKVRLTGGEPLLRPNMEELVARISAISGISRIGLTTNGMLLASKVRALREAGLTDVNISLDSLQPERFAKITGGGDFSRVLQAIKASFAAGFELLKLNVVVMQGVNDEEIEAFIRLTLEYPLQVRFIEYMPIGSNINGWHAGFMPLHGILDRCAQAGWSVEPAAPADSIVNKPFGKTADAGPVRYFRLAGAIGQFGLIDPISKHFCNTCNRLRITANGHIKPCLFWNEEWNIRPYIGNELLLKQLFKRSLENKPVQHGMNTQQMNTELQQTTIRQMSQIGG